MDRRSFFKSIAVLAGAASLSPSIFIPKFEPVRWKRSSSTIGNFICVVNQEYVTAEFEEVIIQHPNARFKLPYPARYKMEDGQRIYIPPFKLIPF